VIVQGCAILTLLFSNFRNFSGHLSLKTVRKLVRMNEMQSVARSALLALSEKKHLVLSAEYVDMCRCSVNV